MWAPRKPAHRILVARHERERAVVRCAQVKRADDAVDACGRDEAGGRVLVPVVGEDLGGLGWGQGLFVAGLRREQTVPVGGGLVYRDVGDEVVFGGDGRAKVEDPEARVGGDGGDEGRVVR